MGGIPFVFGEGNVKSTQDDTRLRWALQVMNAVATAEELMLIKNTNTSDSILWELSKLLEKRLLSRVMQQEIRLGKPVKGQCFIPGLETRITRTLKSKHERFPGGAKFELPDFKVCYVRKNPTIDDLANWYDESVKKKKSIRLPKVLPQKRSLAKISK